MMRRAQTDPTPEIDFAVDIVAAPVRACRAHGCALLRNFADPSKLETLRDVIDGLYEVEGGYHIRPHQLADRGLPQFHEYFFEEKHRDLLAEIFRGRQYSMSPATASRRVFSDDRVDPEGLWMAPLPPHIDAFFHPFEFTVNFWVPLQPCGPEIPRLGVVCADFEDVRKYFGYDGGAAVNGPFPEWNLARFNQQARDLAYGQPDTIGQCRATFAERSWTPTYELGDAMMLSNWTLHFTHVTPSMNQRRSNVELRFSSDASLEALMDETRAV